MLMLYAPLPPIHINCKIPSFSFHLKGAELKIRFVCPFLEYHRNQKTRFGRDIVSNLETFVWSLLELDGV